MIKFNISSIILQVYSFLRIIPSKKYSCLNKIGQLFWMLVGLIGGVGVLVWDFKNLNLQITPYIIAFLASDFLTLLLITLSFPAIVYLVKENDYLQNEPEPPIPMRFWHLLANLIMYGANTISLILIYAPAYTSFYLVFLVLYNMNSFLVVIAEMVLFGIYAAWFSKQAEELIQQPSYDFPHQCYQLINHYQQLKKGSAPLLFLIYTVDTCNVIFMGYLTSGEMYVGFYILFIGMKLSYITFVLEDCYTQFKNIGKAQR